MSLLKRATPLSLSLSLSLSLAVATLLSLPFDNARLGLRRKPNFRAEREETKIDKKQMSE
jgi:hypothetical protein